MEVGIVCYGSAIRNKLEWYNPTICSGIHLTLNAPAKLIGARPDPINNPFQTPQARLRWTHRRVPPKFCRQGDIEEPCSHVKTSPGSIERRQKDKLEDRWARGRSQSFKDARQEEIHHEPPHETWRPTPMEPRDRAHKSVKEKHARKQPRGQPCCSSTSSEPWAST